MTTTAEELANLGVHGHWLAPPPTTRAARRQWLEARNVGLGASDVAAVLGLAPASWGATPLTVWLEKTDPEAEGLEVTEQMEWGLQLEDPVARMFSKRHAKELGVRVRPTPGLLQHEEHPWLLCTPDRLLVSKDDEGRPVCKSLLEIKTAHYTHHRDWYDEDRQPRAPFHYQIQCQVQMAVTGAERVYLVPLFGGNHMPDPWVIERDDQAIAQIIEICGAWWEQYVVGRTPPPALLPDLPILDDVWPGDGSQMELPDHILRRLALRARMKQRIDMLGKAVDRIDLDTKVAMKDAVLAVDHDGRKVAKWSRFPMSKFSEKDFRRDHPGLYEQYRRKTNSQRFTVTATTPEGDNE